MSQQGKTRGPTGASGQEPRKEWRGEPDDPAEGQEQQDTHHQRQPEPQAPSECLPVLRQLATSIETKPTLSIPSTISRARVLLLKIKVMGALHQKSGLNQKSYS